MYLLYLDDAGSVGDKGQEYFVLGGVCVFERQVRWITEGMDALAASLNPAEPHTVEFHASAILAGRRAPWRTMEKNERSKVIKKVLALLTESRRITVAKAGTSSSTRAFACAVHKKSFPAINPVELAFEDLCKRFDMFLQRFYTTGNRPERGLIIMDSSSYETNLQELARDFRSIGTRWGDIYNMTDVPFFVDSRASRLVQLADHVAYAVFRRYERGDALFLDAIINDFHEEEGKIHGLAHKQHVLPRCTCPACLSR